MLRGRKFRWRSPESSNIPLGAFHRESSRTQPKSTRQGQAKSAQPMEEGLPKGHAEMYNLDHSNADACGDTALGDKVLGDYAFRITHFVPTASCVEAEVCGAQVAVLRLL